MLMHLTTGIVTSKGQLSPMFRDCLTHVVYLPDFLKSFQCIQYDCHVCMSVLAWLQLLLGTQSDHAGAYVPTADVHAHRWSVKQSCIVLRLQAARPYFQLCYP